MSASESNSRLILCGAIAGPLFAIMFMVLGANRSGYDPLRHPVSALSLGDGGWLQILTFLVTGGLLAAFALALWQSRAVHGSTLGAASIGLAALGLIGAGIFPTDPIGGYPVGSPADSSSVVGLLHGMASMLFFAGIGLAMVFFGWHFFRDQKTGWLTYTALSLLAFAGFFAAASIGFQHGPTFEPYAGALQRICLLVGFLWVMLLAWSRRPAPVTA